MTSHLFLSLTVVEEQPATTNVAFDWSCKIWPDSLARTWYARHKYVCVWFCFPTLKKVLLYTAMFAVAAGMDSAAWQRILYLARFFLKQTKTVSLKRSGFFVHVGHKHCINWNIELKFTIHLSSRCVPYGYCCCGWQALPFAFTHSKGKYANFEMNGYKM